MALLKNLSFSKFIDIPCVRPECDNLSAVDASAKRHLLQGFSGNAEGGFGPFPTKADIVNVLLDKTTDLDTMNITTLGRTLALSGSSIYPMKAPYFNSLPACVSGKSHKRLRVKFSCSNQIQSPPELQNLPTPLPEEFPSQVSLKQQGEMVMHGWSLMTEEPCFKIDPLWWASCRSAKTLNSTSVIFINLLQAVSFTINRQSESQ